MVGEHLMFFQNNTRSNQFNQPKIQWHSGNIGYSSVQVLHSRLASCDSTQGSSTGFSSHVPFGYPRIFFFKEYFFSAIVAFGVPFSINLHSSSGFLGFRKALKQDAMSSSVSGVRRLENF